MIGNDAGEIIIVDKVNFKMLEKSILIEAPIVKIE